MESVSMALCNYGDRDPQSLYSSHLNLMILREVSPAMDIFWALLLDLIQHRKLHLMTLVHTLVGHWHALWYQTYVAYLYNGIHATIVIIITMYHYCHYDKLKCTVLVATDLESLLLTHISQTRVVFRAWMYNLLHINLWDSITWDTFS